MTNALLHRALGEREVVHPERTEPAKVATQIVGIGTAVPESSYTQEEVLEFFRPDDPRVEALFRNSAIQRRSLSLPEPGADGTPRIETQGELLRKHKALGVETGARAIRACLEDAGLAPSDVDRICCVTSTGFLTPGFSALLVKELGLPSSCSRLDVVGMGCNAGLNALAAVDGWAVTHPGRPALLVCVEMCSAAYVFDGTMRTAVVNSLFGDGAAALAVVGGTDARRPSLVRFASTMIPEAIDAMRYDWDDEHGKFSFFLDKEIPYVIGANAEEVVGRLLSGTGLRRRDIAHWIVHSGGKKVIDAVAVNLGLTRHEIRHTTGVLRDHGNVSSGSFLFSYERLAAEGAVRPGDHGVLMTMGPGSTIETALVRF
ncbi:3,5-dihydroxyphenylacetyl-CoA synthase DpgA [Actinomadura sp. 9N215]|uniref:3,5-dihydroxyphenylacetyl-CoA synthase DpgA n=1 Tax=Actinomadura sp. 9N215 TaxID=3375150 RepID=UPI0037AF1471